MEMQRHGHSFEDWKFPFSAHPLVVISNSRTVHGDSEDGIKPTRRPFSFPLGPHVLPTRLPSLSLRPLFPLPDMASAQDHAPVIKELSERRQQDPQLTFETPRDPSPPRFSQLHDPQPDATESNPSRRATSTATNPSTLVNQPGAVGSNIGPANSGVQNASATQDRIHQPTTLAPTDRRAPTWFDHIRGENTGQSPLSDDGDHDRRFSTRRISIPRPLPVFNPVQDGNENRNGSASRVGHRGISGPEWNSDPQEFHEPQHPVRLILADELVASEIRMIVSQMEKTVFQRIEKTHQAATAERDKYKRKGT